MSTTLGRWRSDPVKFVEQNLFDPETGKPFVLNAAEKAFMAHCWKLDATGRPVFPEQVYSAPKKSGKTGFAAMHLLTTTMLYGSRYAESYCIANDLEQSQGRVFQACRRIVECSPILSRECVCTANQIKFESTGSTITAIGADYASAAGANPTESSFDELWGYTSERARRLWDEMVPVPTRKVSIRLTTTYAGFENESVLLQELHQRGLLQPLIGKDLRAGDGLLMFWTHEPVATYQTQAWIDQMRKALRPNQFARMIENRFVTSESSFVEMPKWDACTTDYDSNRPLMDRNLDVWVGVDASHKRDSTAVVAVTLDRGRVRVVFHRIWQPSPEEPLDFEATIQRTILDLCNRFSVREVLFDPWQLQAVAQQLAKQGVPIVEFPQSSPNLTAASQNLYELINGGSLICYPDPVIRRAVSRATAVETPRGWRISKAVVSHKIDVVVAMAMACWACVRQQGEEHFDLNKFLDAFNNDGPSPSDAQNAFRRSSMFDHVMRAGGFYGGAGTRVFDWSRFG